jgi:hypothetical protein
VADPAEWNERSGCGQIEGRNESRVREIEQAKHGVFPAMKNPAFKDFLGCAALTLVLAVAAAPADAKGCLKGAVVGGAAGHVAGHHGVIGAAAGCAIGHHEANKNAQAPTK